MLYELLIFCFNNSVILDLDWNKKNWIDNPNPKSNFEFGLSNHNPIHQIGFQSGVSNAIQQNPDNLLPNAQEGRLLEVQYCLNIFYNIHNRATGDVVESTSQRDVHRQSCAVLDRRLLRLGEGLLLLERFNQQSVPVQPHPGIYQFFWLLPNGRKL